LDDQLRSFFREKVIETAGSSSSYGVAFNDGSTSPVPRLVKDFIAGMNTDFVVISREIAKHLHDSQGGVNPGGLVTIIECQVDSTVALAILKLEREEGVRLASIEYKGKHTFDVRYIRDLILTRKTKLFKIGLFFPVDGDDVEGVVCDEQRPYHPRTEVADFFLSTFLGCGLLDDPRVATKRFFLAAQDFFNDQITDPAARTNALRHLLSEITSERGRINVRDFAQDYLPADKRKAFIDHIQEAGLGSLTIKKNPELIEAQTRNMAIEMENGVAVVGNREAIDKNVKVHSLPDGAARIEVTGRLKRVRGK
jgi:hypothetical protein